MKKFILSIAILVCLAFALPALSEGDILSVNLNTASYESIVEAIDLLNAVRRERLAQQYSFTAPPSVQSSITFRSIPWLTSKAEIEKLLGEPESTNNWVYLDSNGVNTDGIGFTFRYTNLDVAGLPSAYTRLSFLYPVVDGVLLNDEKLGMLDFAQYDLRKLGDAQAVADELAKKLSHLYGECETSGYRRTWTDDEGNRVELWCSSSSMLDISYFSAQHDRLYAEGKQYINQQRAAEEELTFLQNQGNYDGL